MTKAFPLFFFLVIACFAEIGPLAIHRDAIQLQSTEWVVPELIIGGEWTSSIKLTNRGSVAIPTTNVSFWDNNGNPMTTTFQATSGQIITGTGFSFSLPIGAIVEGAFNGGTAGIFGSATIACSALGCGTHGLYGEVTLRNHNSTRPDFVVVFPLESPATTQYMFFDGRPTSAGSITTTLYVVNNSSSPATMAMDVRDTNNALIDGATFSFTARASQILTLHALTPATIGASGTLIFRSTSIDPLTGGASFITVTSLRVDPSNSFAPVRSWVPGN
jgi:hypothetical protein